VNPSLQQRVNLANQAKADLFISIHHNSSSSGTFDSKRGTLVLYNHKDKSEFSSLRLANICLDNVVASTGGYRMGLLQGNYVHIVDNCQVPMALIEVGYMTNLAELEELQKPEYQKKAAQGIYNAILQAFAEGY
jgi:N-acetylmuramoyl-L-alanine amidase